MKQGILIAIFVVLGAAIIAGGAWYANSNLLAGGGASPDSGDLANGSQPQEQASNLQATSTVTSSTQSMDGLKIVDTTVGTGTVAENGDVVTVNYTGTFDDGKKFDSSYDNGQPLSFTLGTTGIIQGWNLGVLGMKVGGTRELTIPSDLGYGPEGRSPVIPPNATLHFTITLLSVSNPAAQ